MRRPAPLLAAAWLFAGCAGEPAPSPPEVDSARRSSDQAGGEPTLRADSASAEAAVAVVTADGHEQQFEGTPTQRRWHLYDAEIARVE